MATVFEGLPAGEGVARGAVHLLRWGVTSVPHETMESGEVAGEVERFHEARRWAQERIKEIREATEARLGPVEARIFEPQIVMLEDPEVVDGTVRYIEENRLTAARAFEWRMLELQARWMRTAHPMVLDKLSDLEDMQIRVLSRLVDGPDPSDLAAAAEGEGVVLVARNLTPSLAVQADPEHVLGIATDQGVGHRVFGWRGAVHPGRQRVRPGGLPGGPANPRLRQPIHPRRGGDPSLRAVSHGVQREPTARLWHEHRRLGRGERLPGHADDADRLNPGVPR
jgi:hypothetical protein